VLEQGPIRYEFFGGAERSVQLAPLYANLAAARDVHFLDAGAHIAVSPIDGVHFDAQAHRTLAAAVAAKVQQILA
jgi:lysophospholipase L1-like esterase